MPLTALSPFGAADRVMVLGLDCASPWLLFDRWRDELPHLRACSARGAWGPLRSCHPPITVPAWMCMASGADPGQQGVYGFRGRRAGDPPGHLRLTSRADFLRPPLWEELGAHGLRSVALGVPGTWPPSPIAGKLIPGPLTPPEAPRSWPPELMAWAEALTGGYRFDVEAHRDLERGALVEAVTEMTRRRFDLADALAAQDDWNLFWMVEIGLDRLHHALWDLIDPAHPRYDPAHPLQGALLDYYRLLDARVGALAAACDDGDTTFLLVSDHGARPMLGGVCVNRWLMQRGLLRLLPGDDGAPGRFDPARVDWSRTRAWAAGGYCARIFLHRAGRDPGGIVTPAEADALLRELSEALAALPGPDGAPLGAEAATAAALYPEARGVAPDLTVVLGGLGWRAIDTIGECGLYTQANDTGPDAANHDWDGALAVWGAGVSPRQEPLVGARLLEVAPLIRHLLGVEAC